MSLTRGHLKDILVFPVDCYLKENGYLGILGYDSSQKDFFISSKTTNKGPFAENFRHLFFQHVSADMESELMHFLHTENVGMVFESIDPLFDPHIIEYNKPTIVLLDVIYRTPTFQKVPYEKLCEIGARFHFQVKKHTHRFHTWDEFFSWYQEVSTSFDLKIEGYMLEDANGFMTKIKLPYYKFWKWMRSLKDKIAEHKELPTEVLEHPLASKFCEWVSTKKESMNLLETDIITLRNLFYKETKKQSR